MNPMTLLRVAVISLTAAGLIIPCIMIYRDVL